MRIACLQFAPQVGDIDNNLNRADAVLSKANPDDLDLLVLPELAFTGYNFKSLQEISPFLEPSGSGISSLWARTTALKYNCVLAVGYPEKVDVAQKWPTSPEYYNSLIVVNGDGETVANYRKSFLYYTDETWALEGTEGFFEGHIPGLGHCAMGICMDLNPYKFEAPWHAFEFAFHILDMEANLVIVSMAWLTREDGRRFSRMPKEPDMDTLTYWVTRMEPLIRAESEEEIIVVFCNRTGIEDDAVYAGTSAVVGILDGEVSVYGMLGRGEKELLVVDTDSPPKAKLIYRPDGETVISSTVAGQQDSGPSEQSSPPDPRSPTPRSEGHMSPNLKSQKQSPTKDSPKSRSPQHPTVDTDDAVTKKKRPQSPKIQIPYSPSLAEVAAKLADDAAKAGPVKSSGIPTPTGPSPTPHSVRPYFPDHEIQKAPPAPHVLTPHPNAVKNNETRIFGGHVLISHEIFTPTTAIDEATPASPRYFWMPPDSMTKTPLNRRGWTPALPDSPTFNFKTPVAPKAHKPKAITGQTMVFEEDPHRKMSRSPDPNQRPMNGIDSQLRDRPGSATGGEPMPGRPSSPKSRNASRTGRGERSDSSLDQRPDVAMLNQRLDSFSIRRDSSLNQQESKREDDDENQPDRPASPKSRNASRSRPWLAADDLIAEQRQSNISRSSILIGACASILDQGSQSQSPPTGEGFSSMDGLPRHMSRTRTHSRSNSLSGPVFDRPGSRNDIKRQDTPSGARSDRPQSRTTFRSQTADIPEAMSDGVPSRTASRGRQPGPNSQADDSRQAVLLARSQSRRGFRNEQSMPRGRSRDQGSTVNRVSPEGNVQGSPPMSNGVIQDIVQTEIIRTSPSCPVHGRGHRHGSVPAVGQHAGVPTPPTGEPSPESALEQRARENKYPKPALCSSSVETIVTPRDSPATPPFEPRTPKAMVLIRNDDDTIPTSPLSSPGVSLKVREFKLHEAMDSPINRPKSAVW